MKQTLVIAAVLMCIPLIAGQQLDVDNEPSTQSSPTTDTDPSELRPTVAPLHPPVIVHAVTTPVAKDMSTTTAAIQPTEATTILNKNEGNWLNSFLNRKTPSAGPALVIEVDESQNDASLKIMHLPLVRYNRNVTVHTAVDEGLVGVTEADRKIQKRSLKQEQQTKERPKRGAGFKIIDRNVIQAMVNALQAIDPGRAAILQSNIFRLKIKVEIADHEEWLDTMRFSLGNLPMAAPATPMGQMPKGQVPTAPLPGFIRKRRSLTKEKEGESQGKTHQVPVEMEDVKPEEKHKNRKEAGVKGQGQIEKHTRSERTINKAQREKGEQGAEIELQEADVKPQEAEIEPKETNKGTKQKRAVKNKNNPEQEAEAEVQEPEIEQQEAQEKEPATTEKNWKRNSKEGNKQKSNGEKREDQGSENTESKTRKTRAVKQAQEPVEQEPMEPEPVEQEPVEPVEQEPVEQEPVEPVEQEPVEQEAVEPVEQGLVEQEPVEQEPVEPEVAEQEPAQGKQSKEKKSKSKISKRSIMSEKLKNKQQEPEEAEATKAEEQEPQKKHTKNTNVERKNSKRATQGEKQIEQQEEPVEQEAQEKYGRRKINQKPQEEVEPEVEENQKPKKAKKPETQELEAEERQIKKSKLKSSSKKEKETKEAAEVEVQQTNKEEAKKETAIKNRNKRAIFANQQAGEAADLEPNAQNGPMKPTGTTMTPSGGYPGYKPPFTCESLCMQQPLAPPQHYPQQNPQQHQQQQPMPMQPVCATNGFCIHEFPSKCSLDIYACQNPQIGFRLVNEGRCIITLLPRCTDLLAN